MQRLGAVFIAICMVAIATSVGAIAYFKFGLTIPEAAPISFGILLTLLLVHYQISRVRDRMMLDEQMDDLTRLKLNLTREVQDVRELAQTLENGVAMRVEREMEPILAELDVIGSLVKQLAESCAELDERVDHGDQQIEAVSAKLKGATQSVKEIEELLRSSARAVGSQRPATSIGAMSASTAPQPLSPSETFSTSSENANRARPVIEEPALEEEPEPVVSEEDEQAVRRALALGQIELFMQPVVSLPMRKPTYYEALSRLKADDGSIITPDIFLPVCRKNNFMPMLDRLAINEAFRLQRRLSDRGRAVTCFVNLSLQSLGDSDFFALMRDLFDQNKDLSEQIILEFSQADMRQFGILEDETIQLLRSMGFRFSVDKVTNLAADFDSLARKGVRFAKIAAPILTHRDAGRGMDIHPADFSRVLSRKGIDMVATHVESESVLVGLIDFNVHLAQGNHFAPAKALKSQGVEDRMGAPSGAPRAENTQAQPQNANAGAMRTIAGEAPRASGDQGSERADAQARRRKLGENPRIAEALKAMAAQDDGNTSTREQFRSALAEAAGLIDGANNRNNAPAGRPAPAAPARMTNRLPASDDFGLKTSTERGQFIDLSEPAQDRSREKAASDDQRSTASDPQRFERLIR